ncbi:Fic family protein [Saccharopolyspora sp. TS4A08]|uniref:Fic family protein n=1 Tax=Saccharopolyspora ipomoeae TaxID=3042027 RepID=A0ABT6PQE1_9PSEU|nr:Fic family protein [Saccharopolyspora sp. TS4A08]MDI2029666.1 Fic family protein [Saccharopolyspora sp. TS4A08]
MGTDTNWPAIGYEHTAWEPFAGLSRRERRYGEYQSAIVPEIADLDPRLSTSTSALVDEASFEIARFDGEMGGEIAPFAAVLLRTESASSSEIEHLSASAKAIALAELGDTSKRNATEIAANTRAMNAAIRLSDRLDATTILEMHKALFGDANPRIPGGRWRTDAVWIGGNTPHSAEFVPPGHEHVVPAIEDLVRFMDRDDVPVLCHAAVAHAQFETIHPFGDGNGRTGRALVHAMLRGKGLTRNITVPVSAGLLTNPDRYFDALTAYRAGDIEPIARSFAESSFRAIANGRELVEEIRAIRSEWREKVRARRDSAAHRILDALARQPVMDTAFAQREMAISSSAARRAFAELEEAGIVTEFSGMKRNRCWRSDEVLLALDSFAGKAGRRGRPG